MRRTLVFLLALFVFTSRMASAVEPLRIGSKKFTESYILAEIMAQKIERELQVPVERKYGLGGTFVAYEALRTGAIDIYPEYSGTALEVLLKTNLSLNFEEMNELLRSQAGVEWLQPFGFNNSYALAMSQERAKKLGVQKYSDLMEHHKLRFAFSHEFLNRGDGWPALRNFYRFDSARSVVGMEHALSYEAIRSDSADVIDVYTTDAKVKTHDLLVLEDDRKFFPNYFGAPLVRSEALKQYPRLGEVLDSLAGTIDDETMRGLNEKVEAEKKSFEEAAEEFLAGKTPSPLAPKGSLRDGEGGPKRIPSGGEGLLLWRRTLQHLKLVFVSLFLASLIGIPLAILMGRFRRLAGPVLYASGILQTIPSIALLALMIPLFGIGEVPALVALFLYGLLPIIRNTYVGLKEIKPSILESADGIGLRPFKKLLFVELPLASPTILAGVKTSAVINVGTATLAAFIGAGGLGEPIVTGLALHDTGLILQGAIPAAALAILVEYLLGLFELSFSWRRGR